MQGGEQILLDSGIKSFAMVNVDSSLFDNAMDLGFLSKDQHSMVIDFCKDPDGSMREFLLSHPTYLEDALAGNPKDAARAKICIDENIYSL